MDSAIQQAQKMINKYKNLDMSNAKIPSFPGRVFPVATLPNGQLLMSDGKNKLSSPAKRTIKEKMSLHQTGNSKLPIPTGSSQTSPASQLEQSLSLSVAMPENKLGKGKTGPSAFSQFLQNQLKMSVLGGLKVPGMATNPKLAGIGTKFSQTQALANLPVLRKGMQTSVDKIMNSIRARMSVLNKNSWAEEFAGKYGKPKIQNAPGSSRSTNLPFISGYKSKFGLPSQRNAEYAKISADEMNKLKTRI